MLDLRESIDEGEVLCALIEFCDYVIDKYHIKTIDEFTSPYMKALVNELYVEI